jgi:hypothetical protein
VLRSSQSLDEPYRGIAVSTLGKVIRRGWDWLAIAPDAGDRVTGLVEAPGLADALALNKADFLRSGPRGLVYLTYRKAIQEAVTAQLAAWGDRLAPDRSERRLTRPVERDLEDVLVELSEAFPALAALVERRPGGQRRLPTPEGSARAVAGARLVASEGSSAASPVESAPAEQAGSPPGSSEPPGSAPSRDGGSPKPPAPELSGAPSTLTLPGPTRGPRKPARYSVTIQLEDHPESPQLGWLVDSTVYVNTAHPAYRRAVASHAEAYHLALTVGLSLAPLAAEPGATHEFVTAFLARWGDALERDGRRARGTRARAARHRPTPGRR